MKSLKTFWFLSLYAISKISASRNPMEEITDAKDQSHTAAELGSTMSETDVKADEIMTPNQRQKAAGVIRAFQENYANRNLVDGMSTAFPFDRTKAIADTIATIDRVIEKTKGKRKQLSSERRALVGKSLINWGIHDGNIQAHDEAIKKLDAEIKNLELQRKEALDLQK